MARSVLHEYVAAQGPLTRENPEVQRIAKATGYSADHIYQVAISTRKPAAKCAIAIVRALKGRLPGVSPEQLQSPVQGS